MAGSSKKPGGKRGPRGQWPVERVFANPGDTLPEGFTSREAAWEQGLDALIGLLDPLFEEMVREIAKNSTPTDAIQTPTTEPTEATNATQPDCPEVS